MPIYSHASQSITKASSASSERCAWWGGCMPSKLKYVVSGKVFATSRICCGVARGSDDLSGI
eukprot:4517861-Pyramimonas_sp.AAC.1